MNYPVQLLQDGKGIYGIGVFKEFKGSVEPHDILLRPDLLPDDGKVLPPAALQMIPGGVGVFRNSAEEWMRRAIHEDMLRRAGLPLEFEFSNPQGSDGTYGNFWSIDPNEQTKNRAKYHGLRRASRCVINRLIAKALEEAADPEAIRQARRFSFRYRYEIYRAGALNARFLQLISVFPVLAAAIFSPPWDFRRENWKGLEAKQLVEIGAPLKTIADLMGVPMALRKVKPGAAHLGLCAIKSLSNYPGLIHAYMPQPLPRMKFWLTTVRFAAAISSDFVEFTAKHAAELRATTVDAIARFEDTADWVRACLPVCGAVPRPGSEFITRRFSPDMSVKTVTALAQKWHEAVVSNIVSVPSYEFPEPWAPGGKIGDHEIVPITNSGELYGEGRAMHHCVGTYGEKVRDGDCYIYSLRKEGARLATIELVRFEEGRVLLGQIRGPCNGAVTKEITLAARKWLKTQKTFQLPEKQSRQEIIVPQEITEFTGFAPPIRRGQIINV